MPFTTNKTPENSTPPWLIEARNRRSSRTPHGEIEKMRQESEPETPSWMKDALAKKKRAADLIQRENEGLETTVKFAFLS